MHPTFTFDRCQKASRRMQVRLALVIVAVLAMRTASANGGPVAFTEATAQGNVAPLVDTPIQLESEDLRITLEDDAKRYRVVARYRLLNPGPKTTVRYGVPLAWFDEASPEELDTFIIEQNTRDEGEEPAVLAPRRVNARARHAAKQISLRLNGQQTRPCTPVPTPGALPLSPAESVPANDSLLVEGWCTVDLTVPPGASELELRYHGELHYSDGEVSSSALVQYDERVLNYPLFPAGFWRGPVKSLRISIDAGVLARHTTFERPTGATRQDNTFVWDLRDVDLKQLQSLRARIDAAPRLRSRDLMRWNTRSPARASVRTSSQLGSNSNAFAPANLLDGRLETAWCEGVEGDGVGEWFELRVEEPGCLLEGLAIVPGYAKSPALYVANGRIRKVRVTLCGRSESRDVDLTVDDDVAMVGQFIVLDDPTHHGENPCIRLQITDVVPGRKYQDTCVSELAPIINCG